MAKKQIKYFHLIKSFYELKYFHILPKGREESVKMIITQNVIKLNLRFAFMHGIR